MKKNEKAIFGLAIAMIFSLAFMQRANSKTTIHDANIQQLTVGSMYVATNEGGMMGTAWAFTSVVGWVLVLQYVDPVWQLVQ